jgi:hypothetical protein
VRHVNALLLLVLAWAVLLLPGAVRTRNRSPVSTVGGFERAMAVLRGDESGAAGPFDRRPAAPGGAVFAGASRVDRPPLEPPARAVLRRRRAWFVRLLVATAVTGVLAVIASGWLWGAFAAAVAVTAGYVATLRRLKLERDAARRVVADLVPRRSTDGRAGRGDEDRELAGVVGWSSGDNVRLRRWDG